MSSHREAPEISKDPVADNTDIYAFVSPDRPDTVTIISNYIPLEDPAGGPNFFEFGDDVLYRINIDNNGDGRRRHRLRVHASHHDPQPEHLPVQHRPDRFARQPELQPAADLHGDRGPRRPRHGARARSCRSPPCNIGPRSTPNYPALANAAIYNVGDGIRVFAGQRLDGFYVDLGSVFDLAALRPFQNLHLIPTPAAPGVNALRSFNVHTDRDPGADHPAHRERRPSRRTRWTAEAVIGVWAVGVPAEGPLRRTRTGSTRRAPFTQVSRLGNPLFNEVIVPMSRKDRWNRLEPSRTREFAKYVAQPELARLLPVLYPGVFPNLAALTADRADLLAILLTGIPQRHRSRASRTTPGRPRPICCGSTWRSRPPRARTSTASSAGDLAGFPNGRRVFDNVVAIELRAVAGATYPLVDPTFAPTRRGSADRPHRRPQSAGHGELPQDVPLSGSPGERVSGRATVGVGMSDTATHAPAPHRTFPRKRIHMSMAGRRSSTSVVTSALWWRPWTVRPPVRNCTCGRNTSRRS